MTDRLKGMKRILHVQSQVKRLAEWELIGAETRKAEIEAAESVLDAFIGDPDQSARLVSVALGHRRQLAVRHAAAVRVHKAQAETTREARSRLRLAECMVEDLGRDEKRVRERTDLERLIDAMAGRQEMPDTSLP